MHLWILFHHLREELSAAHVREAQIRDHCIARLLRQDAQRFEASGQWREAMRARYRELVGSLIDDGVLADIPGRTTGEYRSEFMAARPADGAAFRELTDLLEAVWYGGVETDAADNQRFRELAVRARRREDVSV